MYIAGRRRTASRPSSTLMLSLVYLSLARCRVADCAAVLASSGGTPAGFSAVISGTSAFSAMGLRKRVGETVSIRKMSVVSSLGPSRGKSLIQKGLIRSETTVYFTMRRGWRVVCFCRLLRVLAAENEAVFWATGSGKGQG